MRHFYENAPKNYYEIADTASLHYNDEEQPFHCHLISATEKGQHVLELGCGSAHLCPHLMHKGAIYHGADISPELLALNKQKFPGAYFYPLGAVPHRTFDLVSSLYTIEHTADPISYLNILWGFCRPGGCVAVICPDFVDGEGIPRSVYYGKTPRRIREKLASLSLADAFLHLWELFVVFPAWKAYARSLPPGAFWINSAPSDLAGREHEIDGDAVHFPRLSDMVDFFEKKGAEILATSRTIGDLPSNVTKHNCYILARKHIH
jgi:SAM-dependent methyltransferase